MPNLRERLADRWASVRLAHEAVMVDDAQKVLRASRAVEQAHNRQHLQTEAGEDDGMIHIGDSYQATQPAPTTNVAGTLAKLALAAGLMATGAGVPAAAWLVRDALKSRTPVEKPVSDRDTLFDLRLLPP